MGQDICLKRITPGTGNIAEMKDIVKANILLFLENNPQHIIEKLENASFKIGEGDAVPGLELALRHSRKGEKLAAKCTWKFGFGINGRNGSDTFGHIPGEANLLFHIEILEVFFHSLLQSSSGIALSVTR